MEHDDAKIGQPITSVASTAFSTSSTTDTAKEELLRLIHVSNDEELLALSKEEFNHRIQNIPKRPGLLAIKGRIRDMRVELTFALQKKAEAEEEEREEKKWQEDTERFYKEARITKIVKDDAGEIVWFDVEHEGDIP
jgi:hypothetical protein